MRLITAAYLVPITQSIIPEGGMVVDGERILAVGDAASLKRTYPAATVEAHPGAFLLPGLINAHCHLDLTGFPRQTFDQRSSYSRFLLDVYRYKREVPKQFIREAVSRGLEEAIDAGTTCLGDMGSFPASIAMLKEAGIRAVVFPEIAGFASEAGQDLYQTALALVEDMQESPSDLISVGLGPYAPFALSRQLLKIVAHHARGVTLPVTIHAAETFSEMEFFFDSKGDFADNLFPSIGWGEALPFPHLRTPIQYLAGIDFLAVKPIVANPVHLGASDIELLAASGSKVVYCPRNNQYFLEGVTPIRACLAAGIPVGLGTESHASVETLSLWDEMRACYGAHQASSSPLSAQDVLMMATLGGARVLGLEERVGSLEPGKDADYSLVSLPPECLPLDPKPETVADALIRHANAGAVKQVVVRGKKLK